MSLQNDLQEWQEQLIPKARIIQAVARTPEGKEFIELLEQTFQSGTMLGATTQETAYNCGQFELVDYIKTLRDLGAST